MTNLGIMGCYIFVAVNEASLCQVANFLYINRSTKRFISAGVRYTQSWAGRLRRKKDHDQASLFLRGFHKYDFVCCELYSFEQVYYDE